MSFNYNKNIQMIVTDIALEHLTAGDNPEKLDVDLISGKLSEKQRREILLESYGKEGVIEILYDCDADASGIFMRFLLEESKSRSEVYEAVKVLREKIIDSADDDLACIIEPYLDSALLNNVGV